MNSQANIQLLPKSSGMKPPKGPGSITTGWPDDDIRDLGDRIAGLTPQQAKELEDYLEYKNGTYNPKQQGPSSESG